MSLFIIICIHIETLKELCIFRFFFIITVCSVCVSFDVFVFDECLLLNWKLVRLQWLWMERDIVCECRYECLILYCLTELTTLAISNSYFYLNRSYICNTDLAQANILYRPYYGFVFFRFLKRMNIKFIASVEINGRWWKSQSQTSDTMVYFKLNSSIERI